MTIDLNCDMGESRTGIPYDLDKDLHLMDWVSSVNLACGYHAGDPHTMHLLVEAGLKKGLAIGAHPSFPDREHFGRNPMHLPAEEVYDLILAQIGSLDAFLRIHGARLHHVKPHGALYNQAAADPVLAKAIARAVADYDKSLLLVGLAGSCSLSMASELGVQVVPEAFADRSYQDDGSLTPRNLPDALLTTEQAAVSQVIHIIRDKKVISRNGKPVTLAADTICIHGDGPQAVPFARSLHNALQSAGIPIQPPANSFR